MPALLPSPPEYVTNITIPNGVTKIGDNAFRGCNKLSSIKIPNGVTKIGDNAFWGCYELSSVEIPDSVTKIGKSALQWCHRLEKVRIPEKCQYSIGWLGKNSSFPKDCLVLRGESDSEDFIVRLNRILYRNLYHLAYWLMPFVFSLIGVIIFHYFDEIFGGILIWLSLLFADITNLFIIKEEYWFYDDDLEARLAGGLRAALVVFISLCFLNVDSSLYFPLTAGAFLIMGVLYSVVPGKIREWLLHI